MDVKSSKIRIGYVQKGRGLKGELLVALTSAEIEIEKGIRTVWLGDDSDRMNPWEVEYVCPRDSNAILKLKDVTSREQTDFLRGMALYVEIKEVSINAPVDMLGYAAISAGDNTRIGTVTGIEASDFQQRLIVQNGEKTVEIPAVDEFIKSVDHNDRVVKIVLIDGMES